MVRRDSLQQHNHGAPHVASEGTLEASGPRLLAHGERRVQVGDLCLKLEPAQRGQQSSAVDLGYSQHHQPGALTSQVCGNSWVNG